MPDDLRIRKDYRDSGSHLYPTKTLDSVAVCVRKVKLLGLYNGAAGRYWSKHGRLRPKHMSAWESKWDEGRHERDYHQYKYNFNAHKDELDFDLPIAHHYTYQRILDDPNGDDWTADELKQAERDEGKAYWSERAERERMREQAGGA